jgi:hypothetical protein
MIAVVGIWNAKPEYLLCSSPDPTLNQRRNPRANMRRPGTPPPISIERSRFADEDSCFTESVAAMAFSFSQVRDGVTRPVGASHGDEAEPATTSAMLAGNVATMVVGSVALVTGIFLGLAIAKSRK